jgi:peptide/nickel transport system permease protein
VSRGKKPAVAISVLIFLHTIMLLAGFFAPYGFESQNRELAFVPPSKVHFLDAQNHLHLRPFIYRWMPLADSSNQYQEDRSTLLPIRFFAVGAPYRVLGTLTSRRHLFGVSGDGRIFLMGADALGRDEFSRLLYGGRTSLFAGILATLISLSIGLALGGLAGYHGGWLDDMIMRASEMFLTIPWLYLLLFVRAFLPLHTDPHSVFLLLITVLGMLGWARPARLIRGVVLSAKNRDYVMAAKGFGASDLYLLRRHILPHASGVVAMQTALYIPQYILAEVTLSFFGLGVSEPAPSWGNMLASLRQYFVLESCWWMFAPAFALIVVFLAYYRLFSHYAQGTPQI